LIGHQNYLAKRPGRRRPEHVLYVGIVIFATGVIGGAKLLAGGNGPKRMALRGAALRQKGSHIAFGAQHDLYSSSPLLLDCNIAILVAALFWCNIYDLAIMDEGAVPKMEHGAVWISYKD
jgi:hypothetical protein